MLAPHILNLALVVQTDLLVEANNLHQQPASLRHETGCHFRMTHLPYRDHWC